MLGSVMMSYDSTADNKYLTQVGSVADSYQSQQYDVRE